MVLGCLSFCGKVLALENRGAFVVSNFEVDILVKKNAELEVEEIIEVDFSEKRHGIFRDIPVRYRNDQGFKYNMKLEVLAVEDQNGNPVEYQVSDFEENKRIKIGSPDFEVIEGQVYVIRYEIQKGVRYFEDHDELYWNPVGAGWPTLIEKASLVVRFENGVSYIPEAVLCFSGKFGSKEMNCEIKEQNNQIFFRATESLEEYEGLTVVVNLPKGAVWEPNREERVVLFLKDNWGLGIPLVVFVFMYWLWLWRGKEINLNKPLIAQYESPDGLTPGEVGYLMKEKYNGRFLAGDIVNLAVKGYLKIEEDKKTELPKFLLKIKKYRKVFPVVVYAFLFFMIVDFLRSLDFDSTSSSSLITTIFVALTGGLVLRSFFKVLSSKTKTYNYKFEKLKNWQNSEKLTFHEKRILEALFKSEEIGSKVSFKDRENFYQDKKEIDGKIEEQIKKMDYFQKGLLNNIFVYISLAVMFFISGFLGVIFLNRLDVFFGSLLSAGIVVSFGVFMSKKNEKGAMAYWQAKGFKKYIDVAEKQRAQFYAKENMFEEILPYAIVFGNVDKWTKAFEGKINQSPGWYSGNGNFRVATFASSLNTSLISASNSATVSPSSSGSGGGGFSGGGGGGGGGGSW